MGKLRWYKRDPDAALNGMAELTLAERGAYNSLIDLLYARDGDVPDDDVVVARMIRCHWREWRAIKASLMKCGKIWAEDGRLNARRVSDTLKEASDFSQKQSKRASKRWHKTENANKNNAAPMPSAAMPIQPHPDIEEDDGVDARARDPRQWHDVDPRGTEPLVPPEAVALADEVAVIAGIDPQHPPPAWCGAAMHASKWLREGWNRDVVLVAARSAMARKRDGPPYSIRFFEHEIARELARQKAPLPVAQATAVPEVSRKERIRNEWDRAIDKLEGFIERAGSDICPAPAKVLSGPGHWRR